MIPIQCKSNRQGFTYVYLLFSFYILKELTFEYVQIHNHPQTNIYRVETTITITKILLEHYTLKVYLLFLTCLNQRVQIITNNFFMHCYKFTLFSKLTYSKRKFMYYWTVIRTELK